MLERPVEDIGDDLHVAVRVRREAAARRHAVLVDDAQRPEVHVGGVVIVAEREGVAAVEPAEIRPSPLVGFAKGQHVCLLVPISGAFRFGGRFGLSIV